MTLNELRFQNYQAATVKKSFKLKKLPPTEGAAIQHCYRAYYQLQTWLGNKLTATDWGWQKHQNGVMPKMTDKDLIPEVLLKSICCNCDTGCNTKRCGCRKHGLRCTNLCTKCHGSETCHNIEKIIYEDVSDSEDTTHEEPTNTRQNTECKDDEDDEELEDSTHAESDNEASDNEQPSKRPKLAA